MSAGRLKSWCMMGGLLLGAAWLSGCHAPGGTMHSDDRFTYVSTAWQPWTVSLVDTRTGEALWSVDVPVGQQLGLGFIRGAGPNMYKPDLMQWGLMEAGQMIGTRDNQLPVPPYSARRIESSIRATPEMPGAELPGSPWASTSGARAPNGTLKPASSTTPGAARAKPVVTPEEMERMKAKEKPAPAAPSTPATPAPVAEPVPAASEPAATPPAEEPPARPAEELPPPPPAPAEEPAKPTDEPPVDLPPGV